MGRGYYSSELDQGTFHPEHVQQMEFDRYWVEGKYDQVVEYQMVGVERHCKVSIEVVGCMVVDYQLT